MEISTQRRRRLHQTPRSGASTQRRKAPPLFFVLQPKVINLPPQLVSLPPDVRVVAFIEVVQVVSDDTLVEGFHEAAVGHGSEVCAVSAGASGAAFRQVGGYRHGGAPQLAGESESLVCGECLRNGVDVVDQGSGYPPSGGRGGSAFQK